MLPTKKNFRHSFTLGINPSHVKPLAIDFNRDGSQLCRYILSLISQGKLDKADRFLRNLEGRTGYSLADIKWLRGRVQFARRDYLKAMAFYTQAIAKEPLHSNAQVSMGEALCFLGDYENAVDHLKSAMQMRPNDSEIPRLIGEACTGARQLEAASAYFLAAIKMKPDNWLAWQELASCYHAQGRIDDALECCKRFLQSMLKRTDDTPLTRLDADAHGSYLFMSMAKEMDYKKIMAMFEYWASIHAEPEYTLPAMRPAQGTPETGFNRKIRIGYVGSDFYHHAAMSIYRGLFERADRDTFELYAYSSTTRPDAMTARVQKHFDRWLNVCSMTDDQLFERIRGDEIDILIDLNGHTVNNRLQVFTRKAAPIQITGLGFISPLNIPQFDFFLTDRAITDKWREKVTHDMPLFIPCVMQFTPPDEPVPITLEPPYKRNGYITFGSANNLYKLTPQVIGLWAGIMKKVPKSQIIIKAKQTDCELTSQKVLAQFEKFGILPERVQLIGQSNFWEHVRVIDDVDIALDPFPYQGGVTTNEALYMGCPVISLDAGTRTSISSLRALGLSECIADDLTDYSDRAVAVARKMRAGSYHSKDQIRTMLLNSDVCNSEKYTRAIEAAYLEVFEIFQAAQAEAL